MIDTDDPIMEALLDPGDRKVAFKYRVFALGIMIAAVLGFAWVYDALNPKPQPPPQVEVPAGL